MAILWLKVIRYLVLIGLNRRIALYSIAGSIVTLATPVAHMIVRAYVLYHRVDLSILLVNVIGSPTSGGGVLFTKRRSINDNFDLY
jgi:hypothetical protein